MSVEFIETLASLKGRQEIKGFLSELLTPTEKIMLAKRLAIVLMLQKHFPFLAIERTLKVSPSTISRFWRASQEKPFQFLTKKLKGDKAKKEFWETVEWLLQAGMPPMGRGRWANVYRMLGKD